MQPPLERGYLKWIRKIDGLNFAVPKAKRSGFSLFGDFVNLKQEPKKFKLEKDSLYLFCYGGPGFGKLDKLYMLVHCNADGKLQEWRDDKEQSYTINGETYRTHVYWNKSTGGWVNVIWSLIEEWLEEHEKRKTCKANPVAYSGEPITYAHGKTIEIDPTLSLSEARKAIDEKLKDRKLAKDSDDFKNLPTDHDERVVLLVDMLNTTRKSIMACCGDLMAYDAWREDWVDFISPTIGED